MFKEIKDEHTVAWRTISNNHIEKNGMLHKNAACIFTRKVLWHDARVNIAYIQTYTLTHTYTHRVVKLVALVSRANFPIVTVFYVVLSHRHTSINQST